MSADFKISMVPAAHITTTTPITFRRAMEMIRSAQWQGSVAQIEQAYQSALAAPAVPKEIKGQLETEDEARLRAAKEAAAPLKKRLPAFLFSGTFSQRSDKALIQHSGLICIDLDSLNGTTGSVKEQLSADPHVLAAFISPTGTGLKVILRCDPEREHKDTYRAAEKFFATHFGLRTDAACSDVSRMCFASHDPEAFVSDDATVLPYPEPEPVEFKPGVLGLDARPGDDYDAKADVPALLTKHGWSGAGGKNWTRPGKEGGPSASFDHIPGRFFAFTSSTEFKERHIYKPWHVYAILEHGGDYGAAARALAGLGYGTPAKKPGEKLLPEKDPEPNPQRVPSSFTLLPATDQTSLLGDRYLNRGDGLVISGPSGMGKSSIQTQMAAQWALGRDFHGIRSNGPLKSLIIQSEDSDGDVAEVWASLAHAQKWNPVDHQTLDQNIRIVTDRVNRGLAFIRALRQHLTLFKPDLVWLNPLQAFIDGDVTDSQDLGKFLREGLNGLGANVGFVIVHHTTKPATGKDRHERLWHEVMYDMAGGAELINWARAIISLRPLETKGDFKVVLAKRGRRAGVTRQVEQGAGTRPEPVTELGLRHSTDRLPNGTPVIFWEVMALPTAQKSSGGGRPEKHKFEDYCNVFPDHTSAGLPFGQLAKQLMVNGEIRKDVLHNTLKRWAEQGNIEILKPHGAPMLFRKMV